VVTKIKKKTLEGLFVPEKHQESEKGCNAKTKMGKEKEALDVHRVYIPRKVVATLRPKPTPRNQRKKERSERPRERQKKKKTV